MASERISVDKKLAKVARLELEQELLATEKWQAQILLEQVFHTNESELAGQKTNHYQRHNGPRLLTP